MTKFLNEKEQLNNLFFLVYSKNEIRQFNSFLVNQKT